MLVSVVCPAYNCDKFLGKTLDSILNQTLSDLEVLVVDDCSTDSTYKIAKEYEEKDNRVKVFHNETNQGAAFSRNLAISKASGDFVAFLDGDDLWLPTKLEEQIAFMEQKHCDFSYTSYTIIDDGGNPLGKLRTGPKVITHKGFLRYNYAGCLTVMYRRAIFPNLSIPNTIMKRNDYALWLRLSEHCNCHLFSKALSMYRVHGGSLSSGNKAKIFKRNAEMFQKLYSYGATKAYFFGLRNVAFWFFRKLRYEKKVSKQAQPENRLDASSL